MYKVLSGLLIVVLSGCQTTGNSGNKTLNKLSTSLIQVYLHNNDCNEISSKKRIAALPDGDYFGKKLTREHWQVEACGKIYDFELSASDDGKNVGAKLMK